MSKPDLRLVPRPDGYEFRQKRSYKSSDASDWTPHDAVFNAHEEMSRLRDDGTEIDCVVVCWRERHKDGSYSSCYRQSTPGPGISQSLLLSIIGKLMNWR